MFGKVCLVLWADLRVNNKREGFGARHLMYGSVMEVDAGQAKVDFTSSHHMVDAGSIIDSLVMD